MGAAGADEAGVSEAFPRPSLRGVALGLGWGPLACVAGAGAVLVAGIRVSFPTGAVATAPVWAGLLVVGLVRVSGRPLIGYTPMAVEFVWRRVVGQDQWRRPVWRTRPAGVLALPGSRARLEQWVDEATGTVMVHDPSARTLAAALAVSHGQFTVKDVAQQAPVANGWAAFIGAVGQQPGLMRIQALLRCHPDAGVSARDHWRRWSGKAADSPARASYEELLRSMAAATEIHRSTITIVLDLRRVRDEIDALGGGLTGAAAVMRQRMQTVEDALPAAGLTPRGWLGPDELALVIRAAYDPARSLMFERHPEVLGDLRDAGPMAVDPHWSHVRSDTGFHKVAQLGWPRRPVAAGFLNELVLVGGTRMAISLVYEPVPTDKAITEAQHATTEEQSAAEERQRLGRTETIMHVRDRQAADEHLLALDTGWTEASHAALVVISAPSEQELKVAFARARSAAARVTTRLDTLFGQQDELFEAAAMPLGLKVS